MSGCPCEHDCAFWGEGHKQNIITGVNDNHVTLLLSKKTGNKVTVTLPYSETVLFPCCTLLFSKLITNKPKSQLFFEHEANYCESCFKQMLIYSKFLSVICLFYVTINRIFFQFWSIGQKKTKAI